MLNYRNEQISPRNTIFKGNRKLLTVGGAGEDEHEVSEEGVLVSDGLHPRGAVSRVGHGRQEKSGIKDHNLGKMGHYTELFVKYQRIC